MNSRFGTLALTLFLVFSANSAYAAQVSTTILDFKDQDMPGDAPYVTRMIVSSDYLRMDDGDDHGDFALFDRKAGSLYSVSHDDQRILVIPSQAVTVEQPVPFRHDIEQVDAGNVPDIDGKKVSRYYMFTNGKRCIEVYAVPGYYEDVVKALSGFYQTLAGQHAKTVALIPDEVKNDCDLANNIFLPDRHLSKGFPVREKDYTGRTRALINIRDGVEMDSVIFDLPEGYQKFMPGGLPG